MTRSGYCLFGAVRLVSSWWSEAHEAVTGRTFSNRRSADCRRTWKGARL